LDLKFGLMHLMRIQCKCLKTVLSRSGAAKSDRTISENMIQIVDTNKWKETLFLKGMNSNLDKTQLCLIEEDLPSSNQNWNVNWSFQLILGTLKDWIKIFTTKLIFLGGPIKMFIPSMEEIIGWCHIIRSQPKAVKMTWHVTLNQPSIEPMIVNMKQSKHQFTVHLAKCIQMFSN